MLDRWIGARTRRRSSRGPEEAHADDCTDRPRGADDAIAGGQVIDLIAREVEGAARRDDGDGGRADPAGAGPAGATPTGAGPAGVTPAGAGLAGGVGDVAEAGE
jgi:hypothetical protein